MGEYDIIFDNLPKDEEKTTPAQDEKIKVAAEKLGLMYDARNGEFKAKDGTTRDLSGAAKMVRDLTGGLMELPPEKKADILSDKNVGDFSEKLFGDESKSSLTQAKKILSDRLDVGVVNDSMNAKVEPSIELEFVKDPTKAHVDAVKQIVADNGVTRTKNITTVEDLEKELAKTKTELEKSKIVNFEYQQSLEEIKKTLDKDGGKIQELADKTGKGLMVLLASFIAYVSIDELVDELSGCIVTTKKDGKIISKCKLDKFTCNPYKKEGVYPLCSSLQDFYDASSTDPSCQKNGKNYNDDDYFTSNECQDNGTDNDGTCNLCNSNNKCFTKNGEDGLTYEYSCVKVNAADALGYIMGGLINLVRDTTSTVFSSKWLWYMLGIVVGIMVLYLVFAYLRSRITGETSHFRYKR